MEIKIKLDKVNKVKAEKKEFPVGCELCKAKRISNGKIVLIIPGFSETHYIEGDGDVTYTTKGQKSFLRENFEFIEIVKLTWKKQ